MTTSEESQAKFRTESREQILDGAEKMFSDKGFYGSTTREIAEQSGVQLGLLGYYFSSKLDLYRAVIARRAVEYSEAIRDSLRHAQSGGDETRIPLAELIEAYFRPMVERSLDGGPGWKNYIRLLARAANTRRTEPYVQTFMQTYNPIGAEFIRILKERFPNAAQENIYWSYCFLSGAIIHVLAESESIDRLSDGTCRSSDLKTILEKMGPFFEAGISRLAGKQAL